MAETGFLKRLDDPPRWARTWCYFYMLASAMLAMSAFFTLLMIVFLYGKLKKEQVGMLVINVLVFVLQSITAAVMFWMCRGALKNN